MPKFMKNVRISDCVCIICKSNFPIPRIKHQRERGHIKDLYCPKCGKITQHWEVRDVDYVVQNNILII